MGGGQGLVGSTNSLSTKSCLAGGNDQSGHSLRGTVADGKALQALRRFLLGFYRFLHEFDRFL